ncbi:uncharacterized protein PAC_19473 [Phialocephala subalpina]|uniref:Heterokaryon incompatibility domain-containing protein n=1 Tax=Phialocephala subalpina TaxID=576137 RepID=A0A1L7XWZ2_9HELO|nr:uncharacterized protein PAC_19473 [Phialocephala subalpina]
MGLNDGFVYPALESDTHTRLIVLAPGKADDPIHCFYLTIDLDADWDLQGATTQPCPSPRHKQQSYMEVEDSDGQLVQGFTLPAFRLDSESGGGLHPFQKYTALSYVWGDQSNPHKIFLNSAPFDVGRSLHTALKRLRNTITILTLSQSAPQHDKDNERMEAVEHQLLPEGRLLWIDAMCINQADPVERETQVKLMSRIYRQADFVHADLGYVGDEGGMQLLRLLQSINSAGITCDSYRPSPSPSHAEGRSRGSHTDPSMQSVVESLWDNYQSKGKGTFPTPGLPNPSAQPLEAHGIPSEDDALWNWWRLFLGSPYLRRLWVVQEFALAKESPCGLVPSNRGYYVSVDSSETVASNTLLAGFSALGDLVSQRKQIHNSEHRGTEHCLLDKLSLARATLATNMRDKIYGMLGLASDGLNFLPLVSYSKTVEAVYEDFAHKFVDRGQGMELLYQVDGRVSKTLRIPTWVPDWSRSVDESSIYRKHNQGRIYAACKTMPRSIEISKADSKLRVDGALFDTIKQLSNPLHHEFTKVMQKDFHKFIWEGGNLSTKLKRYPTREDAPDVVLWTLLCDGKGWRSPTEIQRLQQSLWAVIGSMIALGTGEASKNPAWSLQTRDIMQEGLPNALGRRWCITKNGYFGLAPGGTKIGDRVAIFHGGVILFIVRPQSAAKDTDFALVGHGYFHGLMDGEAFGLKTFKPQKIVLA